MDITFNCHKCGQHIAIDEAGAGQLVDCPKCGKTLEVPYKSQPLTQVPSPSPTKLPEPQPKRIWPLVVILVVVVLLFACASVMFFVSAHRSKTLETENSLLRQNAAELEELLAKGEQDSKQTSAQLAQIESNLQAMASQAQAEKAKAEARLTAEAAEAAEKKALREQEAKSLTLEGQVFIVTKGAENRKLGLIPIDIVLLSELTSYMKHREAIASNELARLSPQILAQEEWFKDVEKKYANFKKAEAEYRYKRAREKGGAADLDLLTAAAALTAKTDYSEACRNIEAWRQRARYYQTAEFFFESSPPVTIKTKTDSEGQFQLRIPRSEAYALLASASRQVGESVEKYYWVRRIDPQSESPQKIVLSNDNLVQSLSTIRLITQQFVAPDFGIAPPKGALPPSDR